MLYRYLIKKSFKFNSLSQITDKSDKIGIFHGSHIKDSSGNGKIDQTWVAVGKPHKGKTESFTETAGQSKYLKRRQSCRGFVGTVGTETGTVSGS